MRVKGLEIVRTTSLPFDIPKYWLLALPPQKISTEKKAGLFVEFHSRSGFEDEKKSQGRCLKRFLFIRHGTPGSAGCGGPGVNAHSIGLLLSSYLDTGDFVE